MKDRDDVTRVGVTWADVSIQLFVAQVVSGSTLASAKSRPAMPDGATAAPDPMRCGIASSETGIGVVHSINDIST